MKKAVILLLMIFVLAGCAVRYQVALFEYQMPSQKPDVIYPDDKRMDRSQTVNVWQGTITKTWIIKWPEGRKK